MDNTSGSLGTHDSWSALQIPNSSGMGTLAHTTNATSNTRYEYAKYKLILKLDKYENVIANLFLYCKKKCVAVLLYDILS